MRLISLTANKPSFKSVLFNATGLTLIVGRHVNVASAQPVKRGKSELAKTYNGVGKSLIVALINYCLGSNKNEHFDKHLPGWAFTLTFEHVGATHRIVRTTGEAKIQFDAESFTVRPFGNKLSELGVFAHLDEDIESLKFRSLLSFFLRPRNSSYVKYDFPQSKWTDYQSVLCQSYLLGLEYHTAVAKHRHKVDLDTCTELSNRYKKDKDLRAFYLGTKNAEVELLELDAAIKRLEADLGSFRVAEQYAQREQKADELHKKLVDISNELVLLKNLRVDLDLALAVRPDISPEQVLQVFEETSVQLPALVVKRLDDVKRFYDRLQENRNNRLRTELADADGKIAELSARSGELQRELDSELQFLNAHRALDEYAANSAHLSALRARERRLKDYLELSTKYTEDAQKIRAQMAQATVAAAEYLHRIRPHLDVLMGKFREFSKALYGDVPAGLTVTNNDGINQCRYDIHAHIQNDAADGINQGKIFCYDLLLLTLRSHHQVDFLFHDNRLYADMDKHQRFSLFRLADEIARARGLQYIATVNEDVIDSVRDIAGADFERLFVDPVVLELTDASDGRGKLLGIQADMEYED